MGVSLSEFANHIDSFFDYRKTVYEISHQTLKSNLTDLKLFEYYMRVNHHAEVNGPAVMAFQYYLKKDRQNCGGSINRKIFTLRSYAHFLKLQEIPGADSLPFYDVLKSRQGYRNRPDALTSSQITQIFKAIDRTTCLGFRDYAVYSLMYLCGLRVGEVFALNLSSLNHQDKTVYVIGKGGTHRTLYLKDELYQIFCEYLAVRPCFYKSQALDALFVSKKGNRLAIRTMEDNFKKILIASDVKAKFNICCHTLRHTFASHLNDKDVDMLVIKSLMGHASTKSTEPYIHPSAQKIRDAMEKLPGVIFMTELINKNGFLTGFQKRGP
jgi:site-specific recombinase XerD